MKFKHKNFMINKKESKATNLYTSVYPIFAVETPGGSQTVYNLIFSAFAFESKGKYWEKCFFWNRMVLHIDGKVNAEQKILSIDDGNAMLSFIEIPTNEDWWKIEENFKLPKQG